jgi:hypothetical protein
MRVVGAAGTSELAGTVHKGFPEGTRAAPG